MNAESHQLKRAFLSTILNEQTEKQNYDAIMHQRNLPVSNSINPLLAFLLETTFIISITYKKHHTKIHGLGTRIKLLARIMIGYPCTKRSYHAGRLEKHGVAFHFPYS